MFSSARQRQSVGFLTLFAALSAGMSSSVASAVEATYVATFETLWNRTTHPNNYPSSAHFSPVIGASHSGAVSFWSPGAIATPGIEDVAELGRTSAFRSELNTAISQGTALERVEITRNLFTGESGQSNAFTVSAEYPLVSLATMVAPSSDWFVGVHDLDLRDGSGFLEEIVFDFEHFYDAGTEEGNGFSLSNPATNPQGVITLVSGPEAAAPFLGADASHLPSIGRLTLTRQSISGVPGDFDGDGTAGSDDYAVWAEQFGTMGEASADANSDGVVDAADYTIWRDNASATAATSSSNATAIPEPATILLASTGLFVGGFRRI